MNSHLSPRASSIPHNTHLASNVVFKMEAGEVENPLVIDVSRSGTTYPPEFLPSAPFHAVHRKISPYVERMVLPCVAEGASILMAQFPPTYVDPNRPVDDIDPNQINGRWSGELKPLSASITSGTGLIHTLDADYDPLYRTTLQVEELEYRIGQFYLPYHHKLSELLGEKREKFGQAFQLSCHSMSSIGPRDGLERPHVCLGDLDGVTSTPALRELVASVFSDEGFEVAINKPFRGNELLRRHAMPEKAIYSLQVEIRRDLYIDERTRQLHDGLALLQKSFLRIAKDIRSVATEARVRA